MKRSSLKQQKIFGIRRLNHEQEQPIIFRASEDASVMDSAIVWGKANKWKILFTDLFDRRQVIGELNATERGIWVHKHPLADHHHHHLELIAFIILAVLFIK